MFKFARDISIFILPFVMLFGLPFAVLWRSGEFTPISGVVARQLQGHVLYGGAYSDTGTDTVYKRKSIAAQKPDIVLLGTSRVFAIRKEFFKPGVTFFNASHGIVTLDDLDTFYDDLPPDYTPKAVILALDQNFFNASWSRPPYVTTPEHRFKDFIYSGWRQFYSDYFAGKISLSKIFFTNVPDSAIGIAAIMTGSGYRSDGSNTFAEYIHNPHLHETTGAVIVDQAKQVAIGHNFSYLYGEVLRDPTSTPLKRFLDESRKRNVFVIGLLPPISQLLYDVYANSDVPQVRNSVIELPKGLAVIFSSKNFSFLDGSDISRYGGSDNEMIDPWHASEKIYARLFANTESSVVDIVALKQALAQSDNDYEIFGQ